MEPQISGYRYLAYGGRGGTGVRDVLFREANSEFVLVMDSHVLFSSGSLAKLIAFLRTQTDSNDLWQGPLIYDDLRSLSTHFAPEWAGRHVWRLAAR